MHNQYPRAYSTHRCFFSSVILLTALYALSSSPSQHAPFISAMIIIGIPIFTFGVAAPQRISFASQLNLVGCGLESAVLGFLLILCGRRHDAKKVRNQFRVHVENTYFQNADSQHPSFASDPERLHHARRLALLGTIMAVGAGLALPFVYPSTFSYGVGVEAFFVFLLDVLVLGIAGRLVLERLMIRLWESTHVLQMGRMTYRKVRTAPLICMLGAALGSIASLVIVIAAALASAVETSWMPMGQSAFFFEYVFWFIHHTAPMALPLGIMVGSILGMGMACTDAMPSSDRHAA